MESGVIGIRLFYQPQLKLNGVYSLTGLRELLRTALLASLRQFVNIAEPLLLLLQLSLRSRYYLDR